MTTSMILPGSCIGILGAGQLGKMTAMAAARLGYRTVIWSPPGDVPATHVATHSILKPYNDPEALQEFAIRADVCTIEFENIPVEVLREIRKHIPVRPSPEVLVTTQDRWYEKAFFKKLGIKCAETHLIEHEHQANPGAFRDFKFPAILKTSRLGYDGKGQVSVDSPQEIGEAWKSLGCVRCVLEEKIDFLCEGSVIVTRSPRGNTETYPVFENTHRSGILDRTIWPPRFVNFAQIERARFIAETITENLDLEGILAVEFFFGRNGEVYANELAPRPHNSGHGTIEACSVSQFEQHVRAVCNLPLGDTEPHSEFVMENLIGDDVGKWPGYLQQARTTIHLYGKNETKPGRKMGHITHLYKRR